MKTKILFLSFLLFTAISASAQISCGGNTFTFPKGQKEWSDPLEKTLQSQKMEDKNIPAVPLQFKIKLEKKMVMACHYLVEVTNTSTTAGIAFSAYNDYTNASNQTILHKVKLGPGQKAEFKIIYAELKCKIKSEEDCSNCGWTFHFQDIKPL